MTKGEISSEMDHSSLCDIEKSSFKCFEIGLKTILSTQVHTQRITKKILGNLPYPLRTSKDSFNFQVRYRVRWIKLIWKTPQKWQILCTNAFIPAKWEPDVWDGGKRGEKQAAKTGETNLVHNQGRWRKDQCYWTGDQLFWKGDSAGGRTKYQEVAI